MTELNYTKTHEWLRIENDEAVIGITEHAQQLLGDLVYVDLPTVGKTVAAGKELGVVESVKAASDFYAPVSGVVTAINADVCSDPALINLDPLGKGWLVKMTIANPQELANLLATADYEKITAED